MECEPVFPKDWNTKGDVELCSRCLSGAWCVLMDNLINVSGWKNNL